MRPRTRDDWDRDLAQRDSIETDVEHAIRNHPAIRSVRSHTKSKNLLDYDVTDTAGHHLAVELKARRQTPAASWQAQLDYSSPADVFVLDELTVFKMIEQAPHAYLLIADLPGHRWVIFSIGDLVVIDKARIARPLFNNAPGHLTKGKWVLDLSHAPIIETNLNDALDELSLLTRTVQVCWGQPALWPQRKQRRSTAA